MYTTKPLSVYRNSPEAMSLPPEGPNSGYLVLQDDETTNTCCFGLCKDPSIKDLPFPQNKRLSIEYHVDSGDGGYHSYNEVYLIPVINQPLSSNRYYAIKSDWGKHKGLAYASSLEEDKVTCCFCIPCIRDVKPRPFDPDDIYQQFEFSVTKTCLNSNMLIAKSMAAGGHPPSFFRRYGWEMKAKSLKNSTLGEAQGIDSSLRAHLPDFNFPSSQDCSKSVVVGKWYCPFIFIKDGKEKEQIKYSVFYEMTLEQRWERIFSTERSYGQGKVVSVEVAIPTEIVRIAGQIALKQERNDERRMVHFKAIDEKGIEEQVGLSSLIVERMIWEEERFGWVKETNKYVKVVKEYEYEGIGEWTSFGCYVLVESFVLKRNDGSVMLTYDFRHTHHQLRSKWESMIC
ncbi:putative 60S ribosomal protein L37-A [Bienertia sinuspersici]